MKDAFQDSVHIALAHHLEVDPYEVDESQLLQADWGLDPLDLVLVALHIEELERIDFPIAELESVQTVGDLTNLVRWGAEVSAMAREPARASR